jgi:hypothetical protein
VYYDGPPGKNSTPAAGKVAHHCALVGGVL